MTDSGAESGAEIEALFERLQHPNPHLRERAMGELAEQANDAVIERLLAVLDAEDVAYRRTAVKALGAIGAVAVPRLVAILQTSDNPTVRSSCAKALAQVANNHPDQPFPAVGLQGLQQALTDANPVVHIAAVMALGEVGEPATEILVQAFQGTDNPALAVAIANALGGIGNEAAIAVLTAATADPTIDSYVRETAVSALSRAQQVAGYRAHGN
ncbi:MAG: HEAT repeat domain-containing protein [Pseudanabaenaceae cyanobacterium]